MNLINKKWLKYKNNKIKIIRNKNEIIIENKTNSNGFIVLPKLLKKVDSDIKVEFKGEVLEGQGSVLCFLNKNKDILAETTLNSTMIVNKTDFKYYLLVIKILPKTVVNIQNIALQNIANSNEEFYRNFNNDILVITPSYPSEEHRYMAGFVHSRVKAYKKENVPIDVAVVYDYKNISTYTFENINVTRMSYSNLRSLVQNKKYKKILIHFFDEKYSSVLDGCDLSNTEVLIWIHGPETLYWDWPLFTTPYFEKNLSLSDSQKEMFRRNDSIIKKYNNMGNVKWIFVSNWIKDESEKLLNIKFNNCEVIPNFIDSNTFQYSEKDKEKTHKIFILRRFDNINKYAIDINVRTILELSKREIFDKLEFNIYGTGNFYDELISPIKHFKNVKLYQQFYTHNEIAEIHRNNGIGFFPTRYDAQGVSMCEAGSSGLLIISSDNNAIKEFIPNVNGNIIETENYVEYANYIEKIVSDEEVFKKVSKKISDSIYEKCSYKQTISKEINLMKNENIKAITKTNKTKRVKKPILTIIIPSYNVSQYITKTLKTLIENNENSKYLEILVVNDGSVDNTKKIVNEFIIRNCDLNDPIIRLIDKENGGHGSTINVGIQKATGKYTRIIDGDDWVNTDDLKKLIDILIHEETDIVITDYSEDRVDDDCKLILKENYTFMNPGFVYNFDDLCIDFYGFKNWGPILATANIKTNKLKEANFKLSEKTFYVDMEFNAFYLPVINNIVYYKLDIYRYFIGRVDQSISFKSFIRNIDHHHRVIMNILKFIKKAKLSEYKKKYIYRNIIDPMIVAHYNLLIDVMKDRKRFIKFDWDLNKNISEKKYNLFSNRIKLLRKTNGYFMRLFSILAYLLKGIKK